MYPDKLCRAILVGIRNELVNRGKVEVDFKDVLNVSQDNWDPDEYQDEYVDDVSGQPLIRELVQSAALARRKWRSSHSIKFIQRYPFPSASG